MENPSFRCFVVDDTSAALQGSAQLREHVAGLKLLSPGKIQLPDPTNQLPDYTGLDSDTVHSSANNILRGFFYQRKS